MTEALGNKIKTIREIRNYSQKYMAIKMGLSQSSYSLIEKGKGKIDSEKLKQIALILSVSEQLILDFSPEKLFQNYDVALIKRLKEIEELEIVFDCLLKRKDAEILFLREKLGIPLPIIR